MMLKARSAENVGVPDTGIEYCPERLRFPPVLMLWLIDARTPWVILGGELSESV